MTAGEMMFLGLQQRMTQKVYRPSGRTLKQSVELSLSNLSSSVRSGKLRED
jgi:hypothetical protein